MPYLSNYSHYNKGIYLKRTKNKPSLGMIITRETEEKVYYILIRLSKKGKVMYGKGFSNKSWFNSQIKRKHIEDVGFVSILWDELKTIKND